MTSITDLSPRRTVRRLLLSACAAALLASCVDGPFAHANPHDPEFKLTMQLTASRDTVTPQNPVVVFRLITDPVIVGYAPSFEADSPYLSYRGEGVFELNTPPTGVFAVTVTASFEGGRSVSRSIFRAPAP